MKREILLDGDVLPNFHFQLNNLCLKVGFQGKDLRLQMTLREIALHDYYRDEEFQSSVAYANSQVKALQFDDDGNPMLKTIRSQPSDANFFSARNTRAGAGSVAGSMTRSASRQVDYFH